MEGCPKTLMISYDTKEAGPVDFTDPLSNYIKDYYQESAETYKQEISQLNQLRKSLSTVTRGNQGCSLLRKYYTQLFFLQSRFPMGEGGAAAVAFTWYDVYSGEPVTYKDVLYEQACVLFNLGGLYSQLGASEQRSGEESMKVACTYFQCAAGAFKHLKDNFSLDMFPDMGKEILSLKEAIMLGQAQECLLEKSIKDNRKNVLIARISIQVKEYFDEAVKLLAGNETQEMGSSVRKSWMKHLQIKILMYAAIAYVYMSNESHDAEKFGEEVGFLKVASEKMTEALKLSKSQPEQVIETTKFIADVVGNKLSAAVKDNDFVYHQAVPTFDKLPEVKGASLVKAMPFVYNDPNIPDIFQRLIPMKTHEAASMYSEEKAKLLRQIVAEIEDKNTLLSEALSSMHIDELVNPEEEKLPENLSAKVQEFQSDAGIMERLDNSTKELSEFSIKLEVLLDEIDSKLSKEVKEEQKEDGSGSLPDELEKLVKDFNQYKGAHEKAHDTNIGILKHYESHKPMLQFLCRPADEILASLPSQNVIDAPIDEPVVQRIRELLGKVDKMKDQRVHFLSQLREKLNKDDITKQLVVRDAGNTEEFFKEQLQKHESVCALIRQNLTAQDNILSALTEANAKYAPTRQAAMEVSINRDAKVQSYLASLQFCDEMVQRLSQGTQFYKSLEHTLGKLKSKVDIYSAARERERPSTPHKKAVQDGKVPPARPTAAKPPFTTAKTVPVMPGSQTNAGVTPLQMHTGREFQERVPADASTKMGIVQPRDDALLPNTQDAATIGNFRSGPMPLPPDLNELRPGLPQGAQNITPQPRQIVPQGNITLNRPPFNDGIRQQMLPGGPSQFNLRNVDGRPTAFGPEQFPRPAITSFYKDTNVSNQSKSNDPRLNRFPSGPYNALPRSHIDMPQVLRMQTPENQTPNIPLSPHLRFSQMAPPMQLGSQPEHLPGPRPGGMMIQGQGPLYHDIRMGFEPQIGQKLEGQHFQEPSRMKSIHIPSQSSGPNPGPSWQPEIVRPPIQGFEVPNVASQRPLLRPGSPVKTFDGPVTPPIVPSGHSANMDQMGRPVMPSGGARKPTFDNMQPTPQVDYGRVPEPRAPVPPLDGRPFSSSNPYAPEMQGQFFPRPELRGGDRMNQGNRLGFQPRVPQSPYASSVQLPEPLVPEQVYNSSMNQHRPIITAPTISDVTRAEQFNDIRMNQQPSSVPRLPMPMTPHQMTGSPSPSLATTVPQQQPFQYHMPLDSPSKMAYGRTEIDSGTSEGFPLDERRKYEAKESLQYDIRGVPRTLGRDGAMIPPKGRLPEVSSREHGMSRPVGPPLMRSGSFENDAMRQDGSRLLSRVNVENSGIFLEGNRMPSRSIGVFPENVLIGRRGSTENSGMPYDRKMLPRDHGEPRDNQAMFGSDERQNIQPEIRKSVTHKQAPAASYPPAVQQPYSSYRTLSSSAPFRTNIDDLSARQPTAPSGPGLPVDVPSTSYYKICSPIPSAPSTLYYQVRPPVPSNVSPGQLPQVINQSYNPITLSSRPLMSASLDPVVSTILGQSKVPSSPQPNSSSISSPDLTQFTLQQFQFQQVLLQQQQLISLLQTQQTQQISNENQQIEKLQAQIADQQKLIQKLIKTQELSHHEDVPSSAAVTASTLSGITNTSLEAKTISQASPVVEDVTSSKSTPSSATNVVDSPAAFDAKTKDEEKAHEPSEADKAFGVESPRTRTTSKALEAEIMSSFETLDLIVQKSHVVGADSHVVEDSEARSCDVNSGASEERAVEPRVSENARAHDVPFYEPMLDKEHNNRLKNSTMQSARLESPRQEGSSQDSEVNEKSEDVASAEKPMFNEPKKTTERCPEDESDTSQADSQLDSKDLKIVSCTASESSRLESADKIKDVTVPSVSVSLTPPIEDTTNIITDIPAVIIEDGDEPELMHPPFVRQCGRESFYIADDKGAAWMKYLSDLDAAVECLHSECMTLCKRIPGGTIDGFSQMWNDLGQVEELDACSFTSEAGRMNVNKNRYRDILPWDHTRVKLQRPGDDYINASYIENLTQFSPKYIVTQGPIPQSFEDFWTMIWEQNCTLVAMLTSEVEGSKLKCHPYWPRDLDKSASFGKFSVLVTSQEFHPQWKNRVILLTNDETKETRIVRHLQFIAWPDYGVPATPYDILSFVEVVMKANVDEEAVEKCPIVVHCSAGVGRTGTFCCIYSAVAEINGGNGLLDIPGVVRKLRQCRPHMVQRKEQLVFCYQAILCYAQQFLAAEQLKQDNDNKGLSFADDPFVDTGKSLFSGDQETSNKSKSSFSVGFCEGVKPSSGTERMSQELIPFSNALDALKQEQVETEKQASEIVLIETDTSENIEAMLSTLSKQPTGEALGLIHKPENAETVAVEKYVVNGSEVLTKDHEFSPDHASVGAGVEKSELNKEVDSISLSRNEIDEAGLISNGSIVASPQDTMFRESLENIVAYCDDESQSRQDQNSNDAVHFGKAENQPKFKIGSGIFTSARSPPTSPTHLRSQSEDSNSGESILTEPSSQSLPDCTKQINIDTDSFIHENGNSQQDN